MNDHLPPHLITPGLFLFAAFLSAAVALLPVRLERPRRSLSLLVVLVAAFGCLRELLPMALSTWLSLAAFLGLYVVFHLLGKFDGEG